jgi:putative zinc finger/helix-turn-helix YgiT family protein
MKCYQCEAEVRLVTEPREFREGEQTVVIDDTFYRCDNCGETFYDGNMADESFRRAGAAARLQEGFLSPQEIRELRAMYGLTQAGLERLINAGEKTVVRWERGMVTQNATADTLLRVLRDHPEVVAKLAQWRGVRVTLPVPAQSAA